MKHEMPAMPDELTPKREYDAAVLPVEMLAERKLSEGNIDELGKKLGMVRLTGGKMQALRDLGLNARELGVLESLTGAAMVGVAGLTTAIAYCERVLTHEGKSFNKRDKEKATSALASLTQSLQRLSTGTMKMGQIVEEAADKADKARRRSFAPGMVITVEAEKV